jgi:HAD superfamily hydrolase (TIGR01509 family)
MEYSPWLWEREDTGEAVTRTLEITGLLQYFDIIITSNDVSNYKPHPETFLRCAELMNVEPSGIEVFEDGELGLEAAGEPEWWQPM